MDRKYNWRFAVICLVMAACTAVQPTGSAVPSSPSISSPLRTATIPVPTSSPPRISPGGLSPSPATLVASVPTSRTSPSLTTSPTILLPVSLEPISPENAVELVQVAEIRFSPWDLVMAAAWSPDGGMLAVAAGEMVHLYTALTGELVASADTGAFTHSLAFSPSGRWLAAGSRDGYVRIWDVAAIPSLGGQDLPPDRLLGGHRKGVNSLAFSPDGRFLASAGNDAVARFWDLATGDVLGEVIGGTFAVPSIAFTPDGAVLAMVNGELVRLREVESERIIGTLLSETPLFSLAISPDGRILAAGDNDNLIRLWDPRQAFRTGQEEYPEPKYLMGHDGNPGRFSALIWQLAFSPDGRLLASAGGDSSVRLWDVQAGELLMTLRGHTAGVTCVVFHPSGFSLASGSLDGSLRVWGRGR